MTEPLLLLSGRTQYAEPTPADGSVIPLSVNSGGRVRVASQPTSAATAYALTGAASTNAALVASTSKSLFEMTVFNPTASTVYVRLYNKATAPVVGTDIPILVVPVPANGTYAVGYGALGKRFSAGIGLSITGAAANADATAVAAGVLVSLTHI